jgi:serine protease AprX
MDRRTPILAVVAGLAALAPAASAAPGDVVNKADANFPTLATAATVEKIEGKEGLDLRATGSDGRPVDIEALLGEDRAKRRDAFGALDVALAHHLDGLADDELVPVAIWLVEPERTLGRRPEEGAGSEDVDKLAQLQTRRRAAEVAEVTTPFLERLRRLDEQAAASTSSPLVWATVPAGVVRDLASDERVDTIYGDLERGGPETNLSREVVGANLAPANTLDGSGVQVGIVESGGLADTTNPFMTIERSDPGPSCGTSTAHATGVAGIIGARPGVSRVFGFPIRNTLQGFAPASRLSVGSWCGTGDHRPRIDSAADWGARVITNSYFTGTTGAVTADDRHADGLVHNRWRLFVKSAGNRGTGDGRVTSPGNGYNVLAVGNVDLRGTPGRADDIMRATSSFVDPTSTNGDREKPELSAPGTNIQMLSNGFPWPGQTDSGTSFAAPMAAGTAARLVQRKPFLGIWPEQLRAILMAGAVNNIEGATRLSDVDGAGMMAVNTAARILDDNRHGGRHVDCNTFGRSQVVSSTALGANQRLRAAISWTADPSAVDHANRPSADLDLEVRGPGGSSFFSASFDNTTEIVDFRAPTAGTYEVRVINFRCARSTFVGWAHTNG